MNCIDHKLPAWQSTFAIDNPTTQHSVSEKHVCQEDVAFVEEGLNVDSESRLRWNLYCVCDGHGGAEAAEYVKTRLWEVLKSELPRQLPDSPTSFSSWEKQIRQAINKSFLVIEKEFADRYGESGAGSTLTVALLCGWLLTVANLGDTEAVVDLGMEYEMMTNTHRLEESQKEQDRMREAGVQLARLCADLSGPAEQGDVGLGPQRCWPGGLANSRSIGDLSAGNHVLSSPHIKQCVLPSQGSRLIIGSDGLWDLMDHHTVCYLTRCCSTAEASQRLVTTAVFRNQWAVDDDITVLVVDVLPDQGQSFAQLAKSLRKAKKKKGKFLGCFCGAGVDLVDCDEEKTSQLVHVAEIDYASASESEDEERQSGMIMASTEQCEDSASDVSNTNEACTEC